jgi:hypothetical protein
MAAFNGYTDAILLGKGLVEGMIDVLPDESFLSNCKTNSTDLYDNSIDMRANFGTDAYEDGLTSL